MYVCMYIYIYIRVCPSPRLPSDSCKVFSRCDIVQCVAARPSPQAPLTMFIRQLLCLCLRLHICARLRALDNAVLQCPSQTCSREHSVRLHTPIQATVSATHYPPFASTLAACLAKLADDIRRQLTSEANSCKISSSSVLTQTLGACSLSPLSLWRVCALCVCVCVMFFLLAFSCLCCCRSFFRRHVLTSSRVRLRLSSG